MNRRCSNSSCNADSGLACAVPPCCAATALALTVEEWDRLGLDKDEQYSALGVDELLTSLVDRTKALLLVRCVALASRQQETRHPVFQELSTSSICRTVLVGEMPWSEYAEGITQDFVNELEAYIRIMFLSYNETPYHCHEHAFHVLLSANKLIDIMLETPQSPSIQTFGLRNDAMAHFALLFAALIHDVEHKGVPNRQLVIENDPLAVLYNDQSVAEQRSLFIAFEELLKPNYQTLRTVLFHAGDADSEAYRRFRKMVIAVVLNTDIASPERTQIGKSKWKEAFGDEHDSLERKMKKQMYTDNDSNDSSCSASETPESSDVEGETDNDKTLLSRINGLGSFSIREGNNEDATSSSNHHHKDFIHDVGASSDGITPMTITNPCDRRRDLVKSHTRSMPLGRRSSVQMLQNNEVEAAKFQRRLSSISNGISANSERGQRNSLNYRRRLSICRSIDFSGESIEAYRRGSAKASNNMDEPDELKAAVVMETIMTAADVAHNLQGWDQMAIWSGRLYLELRKAHLQNRGGDPEYRWFENQIGFLESYLLPLAHRLEDTGVFGGFVGRQFATIVTNNRDTWLTEGQEVTDVIVSEGKEEFNEITMAEDLKKREEKKQQNLVDLSAQITQLTTMVQAQQHAGLTKADSPGTKQLASLLAMLQTQIA